MDFSRAGGREREREGGGGVTREEGEAKSREGGKDSFFEPLFFFVLWFFVEIHCKLSH